MNYFRPLLKKKSKNGYPYRIFSQFDTSSIKNAILEGKRNNSLPRFVISKIEICPTSFCNYRCNFCYGKWLKPKSSSSHELPIEIIENNLFLNLRKNKKFSGQDPIIVLGGLYSEPLSYSKIKSLIELLKKYQFRFAIYTNGYFLGQELQELICESALKADSSPSYISFNFTASFFNQDHQKLIKKIKNLIKLRNKTNSSLKINIPILIPEQNKEFLKELKVIQNTLLKIKVDTIRYSLPQKPINLEPSLQSEINRGIKKLKELGGDKIYLRSPSKPFTHCFVMSMSSSISPEGDVYPCSQTCTLCFKKMSYGSIKRQKFSEIWRSKKHLELFRNFSPQIENCRCNVVDEQFNRICANFY